MSGVVVVVLVWIGIGALTWLLVRMDDRINRLDAKLSVLAGTLHDREKGERR